MLELVQTLWIKTENRGGNISAAIGPTNTDIMEKLNTVMMSMALKTDVDAVKNDMGGRLQILKDEVQSIAQQTKMQISEAVDPVKNELADVRTDINQSTLRITKLEEFMNSTINAGPRSPGAAQSNAVQDYEKTVYIEGLKTKTIEEAKEWVSQLIWQQWGPEPVAIYCKGEYRDFVFASFSTKENRDRMVQVLQNTKETNGLRIKEDLPANLRAPKNILLGLRWKLMQWQFKNVSTDKACTKLFAGNTTVLEITIVNNIMQYTWDDEWKTWAELQNDQDVKKTFADAE